MSARNSIVNLDDAEASRDLALILVEIQESEDPVVLLVRGAIILDTLLTGLLESYLLYSATKFARKYNLGFAAKCDLALATGLLSESERSILLDFNKFRNRAAHRIEVRVSEDEVQALLKDLERYGWSATHVSDDSTPLSTMETLREVVISLVGLLGERSAQVTAAGRLSNLGNDLDAESWKKLGLLGSLVAIITTSRERIIQLRQELFSETVRKAVASLETEFDGTGLTGDELTLAINQHLERFATSTDDIREAVLEELEPLARKIGVRLSIAKSLRVVTLENDAYEAEAEQDP